MDSCRSCGATLSIGASDCARCGTPMRTEPPGPGTGECIDPSRGLVANLFRGNVGLARTYWVYGVLAGIALGLVCSVAARVSQSVVVALLGLLLVVVYQVFISIAIWRAAGKYPGSKVWVVLARVAAVAGPLYSLYSLFK